MAPQHRGGADPSVPCDCWRSSNYIATVAESGYADYESEVWLGLLAPAKTSADNISQLAGWFVSAMKAPGVEAKLLALGLYPTGLCGKDFSEFIRRKNEKYDRIIREANIKVQ
jgi:tripartite-type tricarboxylate transporter receptor subunit TctC